MRIFIFQEHPGQPRKLQPVGIWHVHQTNTTAIALDICRAALWLAVDLLRRTNFLLMEDFVGWAQWTFINRATGAGRFMSPEAMEVCKERATRTALRGIVTLSQDGKFL